MRAPDTTPATVEHVLDRLDAELVAGQAHELERVPLGFPLLDDVLGGGLRPGDLTVIGGAPGIGKTIAALQWARNVAASGRTVVYACYEHDQTDLLMRLLACELAEVAGPGEEQVEKMRLRLEQAAAHGGRGLDALFDDPALAGRVRNRLDRYATRLHLVSASGADTGLEELDGLLPTNRGLPPVLFVDYLQKVAVKPEPADEAVKVTRVVEGLKELALRRPIPVVSVVAADTEGLRARRIRLDHLRGSSALAYECDVALVLNDKRSSVAKVHLAYDPVRAATFADWVVVTVEKNRGGPQRLDLEFRKDFAHFRFDPAGAIVSERLVDERLELDY